MTAENRLIIFGRYPEVGRTKTRLIPVLGPTGAADLQRNLTEQVLQTALSAGWQMPFDLEFCYAGGSDLLVRRWLRSDEIQLTAQSEGDLGRRMYAAMESAFDNGYRRVVLAGTDVPDLSGRHLTAAFEALKDHDLVLGPSTDGGYWLVGSRRKLDLFRGIAWGGPKVLTQTLALATSNGLSVYCLDPLDDIDTFADLRNWRPRYMWRRPYLSVIIPVLNEAKYLRRTIAAARTRDTEVIVVDGGSQDASADIAMGAGAGVISASTGRAVQQNTGAASARGRVFLFLHADTLLPKGFVARIFETLMDSNVAVGAFGFKTDFGGLGMGLIERAANIRSALFKLPYGDQGLFMTRETFDTLGGFPEVPIAEDLFLVRQAAALGDIKTIASKAVTSGRRWQKSGIVRTTAANYMVAAGCLMGKSPHHLAQLHARWTRRF